MTIAAYLIALVTPTNIFDLAVRFAFSGFAAMAPIMIAALFWKRSTKWGALASTLFVAAAVIGSAVLQNTHAPGDVIWKVGSTPVLLMSKPPPARPAGRGRPGLAGAPGGRLGAGAGDTAGGGVSRARVASWIGCGPREQNSPSTPKSPR